MCLLQTPNFLWNVTLRYRQTNVPMLISEFYFQMKHNYHHYRRIACSGLILLRLLPPFFCPPMSRLRTVDIYRLFHFYY
jgi:hypothetical protein